MKDLISIIIPVCNRADLIGETLDSVISQTYTNWECIIVDDGSTDNTENVVAAYTEKDSRIKFFKRPQHRQKGASPSRNFGMEQANGDYFQFLDSDDLLKNNKFEEQLKLLKKSKPLSICSSKWGSFIVSGYLNVKQKWKSYGNFRPAVKLLQTFGKYNEYFPPIVYLIPRKVIENAGYWDETLHQNPNDDGEYFSRVLESCSQVVFCDSTEAYYRAGDSERLSLLDDPQKIRSGIESWRMIQKHLSTYPRISEIYTQNGIYNIYKQIRNAHPEILKEYSEFFERNLTKKKWYQKFF
jgi:glycosyltransferase involved in cell wall biosynthesis